jgi:hypothetical protein
MGYIGGAITVLAVLLPGLHLDFTSPLALATIGLGTGGLALALVAIVRASRSVDRGSAERQEPASLAVAAFELPRHGGPGNEPGPA